MTRYARKEMARQPSHTHLAEIVGSGDYGTLMRPAKT